MTGFDELVMLGCIVCFIEHCILYLGVCIWWRKQPVRGSKYNYGQKKEKELALTKYEEQLKLFHLKTDLTLF